MKQLKVQKLDSIDSEELFKPIKESKGSSGGDWENGLEAPRDGYDDLNEAVHLNTDGLEVADLDYDEEDDRSIPI